jgi:sodium/hydrogen antiporter
MLASWLISAAFMYILFPKLNYLHTMVIAAALSPTDPVLAASVVGKGMFAQKVPEPVLVG